MLEETDKFGDELELKIIYLPCSNSKYKVLRGFLFGNQIIQEHYPSNSHFSSLMDKLNLF